MNKTLEQEQEQVVEELLIRDQLVENSEDIDKIFFDDFLYEKEKKDKEWKLYEPYMKFLKSPVAGDILTVTFVDFSNGFFNFDGKLKDYIRVDGKPSEERYLKNIKSGDTIDVLIINVSDDSDFIIEGSVSMLYESIARESLKAFIGGKSMEVFVREMTPAGYIVEINHEGISIPAFMPNTLAGVNKLHDPKSLVGKNLEVSIESYSKEENTHIVSRRRFLRTLINEAIKKLIPGGVYKGVVTGTTKFGVFVEFDECLTGMIHKSNVNPEWQDKLETIKPGTEIEFYVKEIIKDKIILTQIPKETVWDTIKMNQILKGKVVDNKTFGTLVSFDEETMGLIHTSELKKYDKLPAIGQKIDVKVVGIDRGSRKIFLTVE